MAFDGVRCLLMRGGTSKGVYFLAEDLPAEAAARDDLLLRLFGSPDERQVDGIGGGHPLTSKAAVVSRSENDPDADVDYLFLQIVPDRATVSTGQPCGNILAGIAPFAVERGLVEAGPEITTVRIRMVNTGGLAIATIRTSGGRVRYDGNTVIAGAPFPAAPVSIRFADTAGAICGGLLPTGSVRDDLDGTPVTCVDNGMPVVLVNAASLGVSGYETTTELEANDLLRARLEALRLRAGTLMGLGDVSGATVPKMTLVAPPRNGGTLTTRTFIPHRCHPAIGVLAGISVATAVALPGSVAADVVGSAAHAGSRIRIEHPTGHFDTANDPDAAPEDARISVLSTARKLFDGVAWPRP
ncbi:4-oxalomesaconate tautomerase [Cryptosporangium aurantiacum]|uniref:4-oxalomesaconate tautomerase n=1 Tax=Cryptosporangium aurantiacum TaxID=134849 RepID=A0A1M7TVK2_9ACTN|nr:4-oxalomesaconate tautomerase [Cryptosporangium aurantiacum]SHN74653.1 4-oxalomesaconate tautomerase [Cryptosporangium aurantiacum]